MKLNLAELWHKHDDEFLEFERVSPKRSNRPDLHAFLLLDELVPGVCDIVSSAEHDEICLEISLEELAEAATEEQIIELIRCGVRYSTDYDCLALFV
jgi:hypothetical protein